jgi:hypothetical protein
VCQKRLSEKLLKASVFKPKDLAKFVVFTIYPSGTFPAPYELRVLPNFPISVSFSLSFPLLSLFFRVVFVPLCFFALISFPSSK